MLHVLYMSRGKLIIIHNPPFSSLCLSLSLCKNIGYLYSRRQNLLFVFLILSKVEKRLHDDVVLSITCFSFFISFFLSFSLSLYFFGDDNRSEWLPHQSHMHPSLFHIYIYICLMRQLYALWLPNSICCNINVMHFLRGPWLFHI